MTTVSFLYKLTVHEAMREKGYAKAVESLKDPLPSVAPPQSR